MPSAYTAAKAKVETKAIQSFLDRLWRFHAEHRRNNMPWRKTKDPFKILLSELMLQQTQVSRVLQKYDEFLINFPDLEAVHKAKMIDVLRVWKGLGYNRRAYFIKKIADTLANPDIDADSKYGKSGKRSSESVRKPFAFPNTYEELIKLPGIGQSTGGALVAFSFAEKTKEKIAFIETNIRVVFMHEFFIKSDSITDKEIVAKLEQCLAIIEPKDVREFYYALYDYGTHLKATLGKERTTLHRKSAHYAKQSAFKGSVREMRAKILDALIKADKAKRKFTQKTLEKSIAASPKERERFKAAFPRLIKDKSIAIGRKRDIIEIC